MSNGSHQSSRSRGQSDEGSRAPAYAGRHGGLQPATSGQLASEGRLDRRAVDGRLDWREWDAQDGTKRQAVQIIASTVQFLGSRADSEGGGGTPQFVPAGAGATADADMGGNSGASDDDIPF